MRRLLGAAAPALVLVCLTGSAPARTHVYARVKCVGLYCAIVIEAARRPVPPPVTRQRGQAKADPGGHVGKPWLRKSYVVDPRASTEAGSIAPLCCRDRVARRGRARAGTAVAGHGWKG